MRIETTFPQPVAARRVTAPPEDLSGGVGAELKRVRKSRRLTQAEVAKAVGLDRTSIINVESGRRKLSLVTLRAIAESLGMDVVIQLKPKG